MPRATTKAELLESANSQWDKMWKLIDSMPDARTAVFDFGNDPKLKEAHWQRDKNLRDILTHLMHFQPLRLGYEEDKTLSETECLVINTVHLKDAAKAIEGKSCNT